MSYERCAWPWGPDLTWVASMSARGSQGRSQSEDWVSAVGELGVGRPEDLGRISSLLGGEEGQD